mgnify:FL=1
MHFKVFNVKQILCFTVCLFMMVSISVRRDGKLLGKPLYSDSIENKVLPNSNSIKTLSDGTIVVNTTIIGKDINGFGGNVPLEIYIKADKIIKIIPLKNSETPEFFALASQLFGRWINKSVEDALAEKDVDAISGATYSSKAIIANLHRGLEEVQKTHPTVIKEDNAVFDFKYIIGLIVILSAAFVPLFIHNKRLHMLQQILNVTILGFWCGTFVSYSSMVNYLSNGMNILKLLLPCLLLIIAFLYPLFGKKSYYCTNVCPFGSLQELVGKSVRYKIKLSKNVVKSLTLFRRVLWAVLMLSVWTGIWSDWMGYELFTAFLFGSASWFVIALAILFVLLSTTVTRPYCRFVCPTGTLLKISQGQL